jgi:hypothetical protein
VARDLGVGRIVTQRAQKQGRHPQDHVIDRIRLATGAAVVKRART